MTKCITTSVEEFEEILERLTNENVTLIFDNDGWNYGSTEEWGDVNENEINKLVGNDLDVDVDRIRVDVSYGEVIIICK